MHSNNAIRPRQRFTRFTCQICDKVFATQDTLNQHLITHRTPSSAPPSAPVGGGKLPFRCNLCNAQYPSRQALDQHRLTYHRGNATGQGSEMVVPVVDLRQPGVMDKLNSVGIRHCIVLSQISGQPQGVFGLPIVSVDVGSDGGAASSNNNRGPPNLCSFGPMKPTR